MDLRPEQAEHELAPPSRAVDTGCPACGGDRLVEEPLLDEEMMPTGQAILICESCGRELRQVEPGPRSPLAEPEAAEGGLLPSPESERR